MYTINTAIIQIVRGLIDQKKEGEYWDYKQTWHSENERLLHDILCFANTVHNEDCYLIIGVSDTGDIVGLTAESLHRKKQADVIDLLYNISFEGDYIPKVSVDTIQLQDKEIDVLTIHNSYEVPYYLKKKPEKYKSIIPGYIYSRVGDRNTPINQNSGFQQVEMLWKKRLGLLSPPIDQIILSLKNKSGWAQTDYTHFYINNPDYKIEEDWHWDSEERCKPDALEFYSYNQTNSSTQYIDLKIIYRQTVLQTLQAAILDGGRYITPTPSWAFIHDKSHYMKILYTYKYMLKDSLEYAVQQFLFDEENDEADTAKGRFDEVVLYFENSTEQQTFHEYIEQNPMVITDYIADARLGSYVIESNNPLERKDAKEKLITAFALKRYLIDFRRSITGISVMRIAKVQVISRNLDIQCENDIFEHRVSINGSGRVSHLLYTKASRKAIEKDVYHGKKYWVRDLLNYLEPISTEWQTDYILNGYDKDEWKCIIKYIDGTSKRIRGNMPPPNSESVVRRISCLVDYKIKPWVFAPYTLDEW